jgi:hypothetical protein
MHLRSNYNEDYAYFMKPTCNAYTGVVGFGIYFGILLRVHFSKVSQQTWVGTPVILIKVHSGQCIRCSSVSEKSAAHISLSFFLQDLLQTFFSLQDGDPYYDANSNMVTFIKRNGAKCIALDERPLY